MKNKAAIRVDTGTRATSRSLSKFLKFSTTRGFSRVGLALGILSVSFLSFLNLSCSGTGETASIPSDAYLSKPSGTLSPGDVIRVSYPGAPELNTTQRIQTNGKVSLPMVGDVTAAGRSPSGLQGYLVGMYSPHLQDPKTLVTLESSSAAVYVSGEVLKPGEIAIDRPMTALEVIVKAGGFSRYANRNKVVVVRNEQGTYRRYVLSLGSNPSQPFYVRPSDVIDVKQSNW